MHLTEFVTQAKQYQPVEFRQKFDEFEKYCTSKHEEDPENFPINEIEPLWYMRFMNWYRTQHDLDSE